MQTYPDNLQLLTEPLCLPGVFFGFEGKRIGEDISWAVIVIIGILTILSLGLLYATAFIDPGFIPRDPPEDIEDG